MQKNKAMQFYCGYLYILLFVSDMTSTPQRVHYRYFMGMITIINLSISLAN